jgi:hypothetical protein
VADRAACHRFAPQTLYWPGSGATILSTDVGSCSKDQAEDRMKVRLAAALTEAARAAGVKLEVTYHTIHECQFKHDFLRLDGRALLRAGGPRVAPLHADVRRHLVMRHGEDKVVFGPPQWLRRPFSQQKLVEELMSSRPNSQGGRLGGFLLVRGGSVADTGNPVADNLGYLVQRIPTQLEEVGRFTRWQASRICGDDPAAAEKLLLRYCGNELTVARRTYPDSGELVGADLFRWLVRAKGFAHYEIRHFLWYEHADYLTPFFLGLAQQRHSMQRSGAGVGGLAEQSLKQVSNSAYGHSAMQSSNFTTTSVVSDAHMSKNNLLHDPRVSDVTLLGPTLVGPGKPPRLLFALTRANPDAKIVNLIQLAASVLSNSRVIFLGALSTLFGELFDPRCVELAYADTDSAILVTAFESLEDCLKPGVDPRELRKLLVDPDSEEQQGGRFKCEGIFRAGLWRSTKCYSLHGNIKTDEEETSRRMKSVARRTQKLLDLSIFGQIPESQSTVVGNVRLRPTKAFEMTIQQEYQRTTHGFNFQRQAHVSPLRAPPLSKKLIITPPPKDCVHTFSLL